MHTARKITLHDLLWTEVERIAKAHGVTVDRFVWNALMLLIGDKGRHSMLNCDHCDATYIRGVRFDTPNVDSTT
jgi:hypothetical protein